MGDGLFSSSGVAKLTGAAASSTAFSLGQDDSTHWRSPACLDPLSLISLFRDMASITWLLPFSQQSILSSFSSLSCWVVFSGSLQAFKNGWHYLETDREATGWESRNFEKLNAVVNELRHEHVKIWAEDTKRVMEKCLYNKYIFWKVTLLPLAAECDIPITNGAWSHWRLHVPLV